MTPAPDSPRPTEAGPSRGARTIVATAILGVLAVVLSQQIVGGLAVAIGAAAGAGLLTFAAWTPLVWRTGRASLGGAAASGALALIGGYLGAAVAVGGGAPVVRDPETAVALLFSLWVVLPVVVGAAVAVAVVQGLLGARRED